MTTGTRRGSELLLALVASTDTVTQFLEAVTGELIVADAAHQSQTNTSVDNELAIAVGQGLVRRIAVLRGQTTDRPYVYAESIFAPERLPGPVLARLVETNDPIGRILVDHGHKLEREPLRHPEIPGVLSGDRTFEIVTSRAYRLKVDGAPMFAIGEWFLPGVLDAVRARGGTRETSEPGRRRGSRPQGRA